MFPRTYLPVETCRKISSVEKAQKEVDETDYATTVG